MSTKKVAAPVKKKKVSGKKTFDAKKKTSLTAKVAAIGTGVAAIGAATYYFFGPKGKTHRKQTAVWMKHMKADVTHRAKKAGQMTERAYRSLVDDIAKTYAHNGKTQVALFSKKLKAEWKKPSRSIRKIAASVSRKISSEKK